MINSKLRIIKNPGTSKAMTNFIKKYKTIFEYKSLNNKLITSHNSKHYFASNFERLIMRLYFDKLGLNYSREKRQCNEMSV